MNKKHELRKQIDGYLDRITEDYGVIGLQEVADRIEEEYGKELIGEKTAK